MLYSLHFRIYKADEEERWIVRSMHNSGAETLFTRSVSAEIDNLEPGTYDVVFKVTATRSTTGMTAEEAIIKYAVNRKEKLLNVGRRFDYAQSKGNLKAMEKQNRQRRRDQQREKDLSLLKKNRRLNQQDRERAKKRKARLTEALNAQMKEYNAKRGEKMKARRERRNARKGSEAALRNESVSNAATSEGKAEQLTPPDQSRSVSELPKDTENAEDTEGGAETVQQPEEAAPKSQQADGKEHTEGIADKLSGLEIRDRKSAPPFRPTTTILIGTLKKTGPSSPASAARLIFPHLFLLRVDGDHDRRKTYSQTIHGMRRACSDCECIPSVRMSKLWL
ncbi:hypothetical protein BST61_g10361 [Cercospora zeina]